MFSALIPLLSAALPLLSLFDCILQFFRRDFRGCTGGAGVGVASGAGLGAWKQADQVLLGIRGAEQ